MAGKGDAITQSRAIPPTVLGFLQKKTQNQAALPTKKLRNENSHSKGEPARADGNLARGGGARENRDRLKRPGFNSAKRHQGKSETVGKGLQSRETEQLPNGTKTKMGNTHGKKRKKTTEHREAGSGFSHDKPAKGSPNSPIEGTGQRWTKRKKKLGVLGTEEGKKKRKKKKKKIPRGRTGRKAKPVSREPASGNGQRATRPARNQRGEDEERQDRPLLHEKKGRWRRERGGLLGQSCRVRQLH